MMKKTLLLIPAAVLAMAAIGATIYKWVDEKGVTHYSATPPPSGNAKELPVQPASPGASMDNSKPGDRRWQQQEQEFKQRQETRKKAEAEEDARKQSESTEKHANRKKAKDELARLLAIKPRVKGRDFVSLTDSQTGKEIETINNAERSIRIQIAEEEIGKSCN